eukprot:TRINITY_DN10499_c0_g1_i1.p1 TRINITY_DN10499_c0_g1~~TRINITY_DN10499_c0_g1_i1.p1  ORF type:complete len:296 (-),score=90.26 TRINITY_DN10499_c0_g1_i1:13-900(-)
MALNIDRWIDENKAQFLPPVCNKLMHGDGQLKVMFVGGPNIRADYHMEEGEELFYMVKGDMCVKVIEQGKFKDVVIKEGEMWILPGRIPHSPQRFEDTVGLVIERERLEGNEWDGLRWYRRDTETPEPLYEEWFHCHDLGQQLKPVIARYFASPQHESNRPTTDADTVGHIVPTPKVDLDTSTTLKQPFSLADEIQKHRALLEAGSSVVLCSEREFVVRALGGDASGANVAEEVQETGEMWLWQIEGTVCATVDGNDISLAAGDSLLIKEGQRKRVSRSPGSIGLEITMTPPTYS